MRRYSAISASFELPRSAGVVFACAAVLGLGACGDSSVRRAERTPGLEVVSGDLQTAMPGSALEPFVVRALSPTGGALAGASVEFLGDSAAQLWPAVATADDTGLASARATLAGSVPMGTQVSLTARLFQRPGVEVKFTVTVGDPNVPTAPEYNLSIAGGDAQRGETNRQLMEPLAVRLTDFDGEPVESARISFSALQGGGSVEEATVLTDADGVASTLAVLGANPGEQRFRAEPESLHAEAVIFEATALSAGRPSLRLAGGDQQEHRVGQPLRQPLSVLALSEAGTPAAGVAVLFRVVTGGGTVEPGLVRTGEDGIARANAVLGSLAGYMAQRFEASLADWEAPPVIFAATAHPGNAARMFVVSGSGQGGRPGAVLERPLIVGVEDDHGNPVSGVQIDFEAVRGEGSVIPSIGVTGRNGQASVAALLGVTPGENLFLARAAGMDEGIDGSPVLFRAVSATGRPSRLLKISGDGQTVDPAGTLSAPVVVEVRDDDGLPVAGFPVSFHSEDAAGFPSGSVELDVVRTGEDGRAEVRATAGDAAGAEALRVVATAGGLIGSPAVFSAEVRRGGAARLVKRSGDGQTGRPGSPLELPLEVQVRDDHGNAIAGHRVRFQLESGGGSVQPEFADSDADGRARAALILGDLPGEHRVLVTSSDEGGQPLSGTPMTFSARGIAGVAHRLVALRGDDQTATAGELLAEPLIIQVLDEEDNPVPGFPLAFEVTAGEGEIVTADPASDARGEARAFVRLGERAGVRAHRFAAVAAGLVGSPVLFEATATADDPGRLRLADGMGQTAAPGSTLPWPFVLIAEDRFGNPATGAEIHFQVLSGGGSIDPPTFKTGSDGRAEARAILGETLGRQVFLAIAPGLAGSPLVLTATSAIDNDIRLELLSGDSQVGAAGQPLEEPFVLRVTNLAGQPLAGVSVRFTVELGGGRIEPAVAISDADGRVQGIAVLGPDAGFNRFLANIEGRPETGVVLSATAQAGSAHAIAAVSGTGQSAPRRAALADPLVVSVVDLNGNPVPGVQVRFAPISGDGEVSPSLTVTGSDGRASTTATLGELAGVDVYSFAATATNADGQPLSGAPILFHASGLGGGAARFEKVGGDSQTRPAGDILPIPLTVRVMDSLGVPVEGVSVSFEPAEAGSGISPALVTSDEMGLARATATLGTQTGVYHFIVTATGFAGTPLVFEATATAAPAQVLLAVAGDGQSGVAGQELAESLTVEARDRFDNPVSGVTVTWRAVTDGARIDPPTTITGLDGRARARAILGTDAGPAPHRYLAESVGLAGSPIEFTASALSGTAAVLTKTAGDNQSGPVAEPLPEPLVVVARDVHGNAVPGVAVRFRVLEGGGNVNPPSVVTDANGEARALAVLGGNVGIANNRFEASAEELGGNLLVFTASATASEAVGLRRVGGDGQTGEVGEALPAPLTVEVRDALGNPVPGERVRFEARVGGGSVDPAEAFTGADGRASVTAILGPEAGVENNLFVAELGALPGVAFTASATSARARTLAIVSGEGQAGAPSTTLPQPFAVIAHDTFGNAVAGVEVVFSAEGDARVAPSRVTTGDDGVAATNMTLSPAARVDSFTASADGLVGSPLTITADSRNPEPLTFTVSPAGALEGSEGIRVTVAGSGFVASSQGFFQGEARNTVFVSESEIAVDLTTADFQTRGAYSLIVRNPAPGGGDSEALGFNVFGELAVDTVAPQLGTTNGGTRIEITGEQFEEGARVFVGSMEAEVDSVTPTRIVARTGTSRVVGLFDVVVQLGDGRRGSLEDAFRYYAPAVGFASLDAYPVGNQPKVVRAGDIDGDGNLDLVTANSASNNVTVLRGDGTGGFEELGDYRAGTNPNWVTIADFDLSGLPDIIVPNLTNASLSLLRTTGDLSDMFSDAESLSCGGHPATAEKGDFNGDGLVDIAVSGQSPAGVYVMLGTLQGTFTAPTFQATVGLPEAMAVGDLDGDGYDDVVVANLHGSTISVLLADDQGNGTLAAPVNYGVGPLPFGLDIADFNGDNLPDVAVANFNGFNVGVLMNQGNGVLGTMTTFRAGNIPTERPSSVQAGDMNGDGVLDLVVTLFDTGRVAILNGRHVGGIPDGTFQAPRKFNVGAFPRGVLVRDLNHDGLDDIAVANENSNSISILLNSL